MISLLNEAFEIKQTVKMKNQFKISLPVFHNRPIDRIMDITPHIHLYELPVSSAIRVYPVTQEDIC